MEILCDCWENNVRIQIRGTGIEHGIYISGGGRGRLFVRKFQESLLYLGHPLADCEASRYMFCTRQSGKCDSSGPHRGALDPLPRARILERRHVGIWTRVSVPRPNDPSLSPCAVTTLIVAVSFFPLFDVSEM